MAIININNVEYVADIKMRDVYDDCGENQETIREYIHRMGKEFDFAEYEDEYLNKCYLHQLIKIIDEIDYLADK